MSSPHTRYPEDPNQNRNKVDYEMSAGGCLTLLAFVSIPCLTILGSVWIIRGGC
jgi:hypothetical protein